MVRSGTDKKVLYMRNRILLVLSALLALVATIRGFGTDGVKAPVAILLFAAAICSILPLAALLKGGWENEAKRKTLLAVIFGCHIIATLFFFPPEDIMNDRPVLSLDHAMHFYQVERSREIFWDSLRLHTYDPNFMAGYPGGAVFDIDSKGVELWCSILRVIDTARAYKLFILFGHLLIMFTVYAACRRLDCTFDEAIFAVLIFLAFWHWGRPYAGDFRFAGMFSFLIVSHISLYLVGIFKSFLDGTAVKRFFIIGPIAFFIHPTAVVLLPIPFIALIITERNRFRIPDLVLKLAAWCLAVVVINAIWLVPLLRYIDIKSPSETFFQIAGIAGLARIIVKPGNIPALFLIAAAVIGFIHLCRTRRFAVAVAPAAACVFMMFLAGFGIHLPPFNQMEPGRFLVPAFVFMAPLAGAGFMWLLGFMRRIINLPVFNETARISVAVLLIFCSPVFALIESREYYRHTLSTTFTPEVNELLYALKEHTDPSGRLMIEDGPAWNYGDSFLPAIIPLHTGVEQIGGPYPYTFIKHHFASFQTGRAMGRDLWEIEKGELLEYIRLYRIRWVLTATSQCRSYFDEIFEDDPVWASRHFTLWEVSPGSDDIEIRSSYGRIDVTISREDAEASGGKLVLPYHWDRRLVVEQPAVITGLLLLDDPVPFISLEPNGVERISIYYK
jgi:hypothetical protein